MPSTPGPRTARATTAAPSANGRATTRSRRLRAARIVAGVDVGGTKIQVAIVDAEFNVLGESRGPTPASGGPQAVVAAVTDLVAQAQHFAGLEHLSALGVGAPGSVEHDTGVVARSPNLAGWMEPFPLGQQLSEHYGGIPVAVDNDVRAGMTGEYRLGAGGRFRDVLGVWFGTGVGGAVVLGGELRRGRSGAAGEIGHVVVHPGGRLCGCGRRGCFEAYAGRASIERQARDLVKRKGERTDLLRIVETSGREHVTSGVIAKALKAGDKMTRKLVDDAVEAAGIAIASAVNVLDVEAVVIGGGLGSRLGERFAGRIAEAMQPHLVVDGPQSAVVLPATLGDLGGALGAAFQATALLRTTAG